MKKVLEWIFYIGGWLLLWFAIDSIGYVFFDMWQYWAIIFAIVIIDNTNPFHKKD